MSLLVYLLVLLFPLPLFLEGFLFLCPPVFLLILLLLLTVDEENFTVFLFLLLLLYPLPVCSCCPLFK